MRLVLLAPLLLLVACASAPILYPVVVPPSATAVKRVTATNRPVIGLALGGGAARGFAHIGVIKVLEKIGIRPDIVVGTSTGSFVGAFYAAGYDGAALEALAEELTESQLRDIVWPNRGIVKGERLQDFVNGRLGSRSIEELPIRYAAAATDLRSGTLAVMTRGNIGMAVRASSAIPGLFEPVVINGHEYVDGGLVSPVPVQSARDLGAELVIAVDITKRPEDTKVIASTTDVVVQALEIMVRNLSNQEMRSADVVVTPDTASLESLTFATRDDAIAAGAKATMAIVPRLRAMVAKVTERKLRALRAWPRAAP
ncbi:MAG: hypothetical protein A3H32_05435 [Betaproteobacteria bacterium RIFCSPLOWO2_02_FULL_63_19]|nr:MAG: hypothetical protein A3H32_05435 [Betaproteobacteria bacterium RIFCSPLOWO2_02_FULL_63_19]